MVVVDASVVVKWYVDEEDFESALDVRDAYVNGDLSLSAPTLLPFEVVNALKYSSLFEDETLDSVATSLPKYGIDLVPFGDIVGVTRLALDADVTIYDAAYVALANHADDILYTTDERLLDDVADHTDRVSHVTEFER